MLAQRKYMPAKILPSAAFTVLLAQSYETRASSDKNNVAVAKQPPDANIPGLPPRTEGPFLT